MLNLIATGAKPRHCFFVSPFHGAIGNPGFDGINSSFMMELDWDALASACGYTCYYSDNDPYVPEHMARKFAERLHAEAKRVPGAGHFNTGSGYTTFGLLLKDIRSRF